MLKAFGLFIALVITAAQTFSCTTFLIHHQNALVFGRNYDWVSGTGYVSTNLRGLLKTSMQVPDGSSVSWVSKYGSITFNQYGKEFPNGGMNEKGLVVELMWEDETKYPAKDSRPAISELQWVQYQLDNFSTVEEVIASGKKIRISTSSVPLHYLVADASGKAATIEFINGQAVIHSGSSLPFPVLANDTYASSLQAIDKAKAATNSSIPFTSNSLQRFATACKMVNSYDGSRPATDYAFDVLKSVTQPNFTKWSIVYDIQNKKVMFRTAEAREVKAIDFSAFNFDCSTPPLALDMNAAHKGNVRQYFSAYSAQTNSAAIEKAGEESKSRIPVTKEAVLAYSKYASTVKCDQ